MDIQFIQQQHRDNIYKIMQLCNCDMGQAYELYSNNGNNVESAVQASFNGIPDKGGMNRQDQGSHNVPSSHGNSSYSNNYGGFDDLRGGSNQGDQLGGEDGYDRYKSFKQSGMNFNSRYQVRRQNSGLKSILSIFKTPQSTFKKRFEQYTARKTNLKLPPGSLSQCFEQVCKSKFPLIVHVLDLNPVLKDKVRQIYGNEQFINVLNEQFTNYGIDTKDYLLQPSLKQFIDFKNDANCMIVFRVSIIEQIVFVSKMSLQSLSLQEIRKKLKQVKSNCINVEMEELYYENGYKQEMKGNFGYQKPMSFAEQRKLKEDRQIRRKQQQEFFASVQPKKQQQKPYHSNNQGPLPNKAQQNPKKDLKKQAQQQRKKVRQSLKIYETDGQGMIAIKLRLPSSQHIKLFVHSDQQAQYLYDYVFSREQDLGFDEDATKRIFDIIEPYDKINLSERKKEKLGKIFEGDGMLALVVNERVD